MIIYVVMGTTGEYSDKSDWPVIAYTDELKAQQHVINATRKANEWEAIRANDVQFTRPPKGWSEYDPNMQMDCAGTFYYYITTELVD